MISDWRDVVDVDFPHEKPLSREGLQTVPDRCSPRGSVRAYLKKILTIDEFEKRRKRVLLSPLP